MSNSSSLENKYLKFLLLKQFKEGLDFAQKNNVDIYASNNYLMLKVLNLDMVETLPILKQNGFFNSRKSFKVNDADLALQCISAASHNCLKWLIHENLLFPLQFTENNNLEAVSKLIKSSIESKMIALNKAIKPGEAELVNNSFNQFINALLSANEIEPGPNMLEISTILDNSIIKMQIPTYTAEETKKYGKMMTQYNLSSSMKKVDFTPILESLFLSKNISSSISSNQLFKV